MQALGIYNNNKLNMSTIIDGKRIPKPFHFDTLQTYEQYLSEGKIDEYDICYIKDVGEIRTLGGVYGGGPSIDSELSETSENPVQNKVITSELATKAELEEAEKVAAAAFNDVNERLNAFRENVGGTTITKEEFESTVSGLNESIASKADQTYVDEKVGNLDFSTLATKEEVQNLTNEMIANEEVHAAAYNDLNDRINNIGSGGGGNGGGSASGGGVLRVWINEIVGVENTPEQIAENISTYNEIQRNLSSIVYAVAETQIPSEGGALEVAVSYPVIMKNDVSHIEGYSTGGYLLAILAPEQEIAYQINIVLSSDGNVAVLP